MPTGPRGEKRPPDVIANAVRVAKIATGEVQETYAKPGSSRVKAAGVEPAVPNVKSRTGHQPAPTRVGG